MIYMTNMLHSLFFMSFFDLGLDKKIDQNMLLIYSMELFNYKKFDIPVISPPLRPVS